MRAVSLCLKEFDGIQSLGKIGQGFQDFSSLFDESYAVSHSHPPDLDFFKQVDIFFAEWGWGGSAQKYILELRKHFDKSRLKIIAYSGCWDRFWKMLDADLLPLMIEAGNACNVFGCMLDDEKEFFQALYPDTNVIHLPIAFNVENDKKLAIDPATKDKNLIALAPHTSFWYPTDARRIAITNFLVFRELQKERPEVKGICWSKEQHIDKLVRLLEDLGIDNIAIFPHCRRDKFLEAAKHAYIGIYLPWQLSQGQYPINMASLGIPMVLNDLVETHTRLYPNFTRDNFNVGGLISDCICLLDNYEFYTDIRNVAMERVDYYNIENCKKRIMEALGD